VLLLEPGPGGPRARDTIGFGGCAAEVGLTTDGATLALVTRFCQSTSFPHGPIPENLDRLRLLSLPEASETMLFAYDWGFPTSPVRASPTEFALAAGGTHVAEFLSFGTTSGGRHTVMDLRTTGVVLDRTSYADVPARIAAAGSLVAVPDAESAGDPVSETVRPSPTFRVYRDGVLVGTRDGFPLVWLDDERLLVQRHDAAGALLATVICAPDGIVLETVPLPEIGYVSLVPSLPGKVLSGLDGTIYDVATGAAVWASSVAGIEQAVAAGGYVLSLTGSQIIAEAY
jgi:hypothetical protein